MLLPGRPMALRSCPKPRRTSRNRRSCVGIANDELRAGQILAVVDLGALEVLHAQGIYEEHDAAVRDLRVAFLYLFVEGEAVLKPGTTAALDVDAQLEIRVAFLLDEQADLARGSIRKAQWSLGTGGARCAHRAHSPTTPIERTASTGRLLPFSATTLPSLS
jgi:hypothetical protein